MRRLVCGTVVLGFLVPPGAAGAAARPCGSVTYAKGSTRVSAARGATCPSARKVISELFNGKASDPQISFAVSADDGGDTPTDITVSVAFGNHYAWNCPVYAHSRTLRGVTCTQYKRGRKIHGSKSVPRRIWKPALDADAEGGGG